MDMKKYAMEDLARPAQCGVQSSTIGVFDECRYLSLIDSAAIPWSAAISAGADHFCMELVRYEDRIDLFARGESFWRALITAASPSSWLLAPPLRS
jgi:hypothetical protein